MNASDLQSIGDHSFDHQLKIGDQQVFLDMAHDTIARNTTFNGVLLSSITIMRDCGPVELIRQIGYEDCTHGLG